MLYLNRAARNARGFIWLQPTVPAAPGIGYHPTLLRVNSVLRLAPLAMTRSPLRARFAIRVAAAQRMQRRFPSVSIPLICPVSDWSVAWPCFSRCAPMNTLSLFPAYSLLANPYRVSDDDMSLIADHLWVFPFSVLNYVSMKGGQNCSACEGREVCRCISGAPSLRRGCRCMAVSARWLVRGGGT